MGIFNRRITESYTEERSGTGVIPPTRTEIAEVTPSVALSLAAVYRCVSIIASTLAQLPCEAKRGDQEVNLNLVKQPDVNLTAYEFWFQTIVSLATKGEAFWWITRNAQGYVSNLTVLDPQIVVVSQEMVVGSPIYKVRYDVGGMRVDNASIQHLRLMSLPGSYRGLGPIQAAMKDVAAAVRLRAYGDSVLSTGGIPTGVLSTDQFLTQDQADKYRDAWDEAQAERGLAVLGAGLSYEAIALSPADMQWLENQMFSNNQIARLFGVPAIWLGLGIDGSSLTYATTETLGQMFLTTTGSQYLNVIEQNLSALLPRGTDARFKVDALLRADIVSRTTAYEKLVAMGAMTAQQVAESEGIEWADNQSLDGPTVPNDGSPV